MKVLIISDIHGSGYYGEKIKEINERENPDKIILLGDLYYHGPRNELSQEYEPMKVANILNSEVIPRLTEIFSPTVVKSIEVYPYTNK